jgi:MFS superfamily sulfate permease-like transporter
MKWWGWVLGLVVAAVAAGATWWAFTSPTFVAGLIGVVVAAAWRWLAPKLFKRMDPATEQAMAEAYRRGQDWDPIAKRIRLDR